MLVCWILGRDLFSVTQPLPPMFGVCEMAFFRPKRRKQAFIGRQNKRPSSAVLLPDAVTRWRGRRAFPQSPLGCHEVNIAEKRLPSAIPITGRRFIHVSEQCIVCCIAFRLLYCITVSVHDSVGVCYTDSGLCGLFSPPPKTANTVPLHTYQRMFFASAIGATDKCVLSG